jgi:type IV pilus assembly protein PilM
MFRKKNKKVSIGLDVGSFSVKVVALIREGGGKRLRLWRYGVKTIPRGMSKCSDGDIVKLIRELLLETKLDHNEVISSLPGTSAVVRYIDMPRMTLQEAREALKYEAGQYIPFKAEEAQMDCHVLNDLPGDKSESMRLMLVAARRSDAKKRVEMLRQAELTPVVLDVDSIAILNAFETTGMLSAQKGAIGLINIGARQSNLNVAQDGHPAFTRDIEVGGGGITVAIARGLGVNLSDAEGLKVSGDAIIQPHLEIVLKSIVHQLRSSFDYYQGSSGKEVKKVYISGGTSLLRGLADFLTDSLGIATEPWDPFQGIDTSDFEGDAALGFLAPLLAVAVGLASRRTDSS